MISLQVPDHLLAIFEHQDRVILYNHSFQLVIHDQHAGFDQNIGNGQNTGNDLHDQNTRKDQDVSNDQYAGNDQHAGKHRSSQKCTSGRSKTEVLILCIQTCIRLFSGCFHTTSTYSPFTQQAHAVPSHNRYLELLLLHRHLFVLEPNHNAPPPCHVR